MLIKHKIPNVVSGCGCHFIYLRLICCLLISLVIYRMFASSSTTTASYNVVVASTRVTVLRIAGVGTQTGRTNTFLS
jgi:hypothetical protein